MGAGRKIRISRKLEFGKLVTPLPDRERPVYRWFQMKESFSSGLVRMLLDLWKPEGELLLDPFCGAGTTPLACKEAGISSVGFEVHPVLCFASRVKVADHEPERTREAGAGLLEAEFRRVEAEVPSFVARVFPRGILEDLLVLREELHGVEDEGLRGFLKLALLRSALTCSWLKKEGAALKVRKRKVPALRPTLKRVLEEMCADLLAFPRTRVESKVEACDAREMPLEDESVGAVITSPPYLFKDEYIRIFGVEQWLLELPPPDPEQLVGAGNDPEKYFENMRSSLLELYRVCKPGARVCVAVSDGCSKRGVVEVCIKLSELAGEIGFKAKKIVVVNERWCTTPSRRKLGITRESLLFWEKPR